MKRALRGWDRGLGHGLEGSGTLLGLAVPIGLALVVLVLTGLTFSQCFGKPPKPCHDYSYKTGGILSDREASCGRWPGMTLRVERRWVKSDIAHCKCPAPTNESP
jgi:hypothetical protein